MFAGILSLVLFICGLTAEGNRLFITTIKEKPYFMEDSNGKKTGMLVDLMKELWEKWIPEDAAIKKDLTGYDFHAVTDNKYGARQANGRWDGMIGQLQNGHAHVAVAPLSKTEDRETVIEFGTPWLPTYLTVLIDKKHNIWTPGALEGQTKVTYGCLKDGSTQQKLEKATSSPFNKIWQKINSNPEQNLVEEQDEAINRVLNDNYAYILESPTADYRVSNDYPECRLATFGRFMHAQGYAFGYPRNSEHRDELDSALNRALNEQAVDRLYQKWIEQESKCRQPSGTTSLNAWPILVGIMLLTHFCS